MSLELLIDALTREASALIASAATQGGARTSLAHASDRLFHGLAVELQALNVRRRVCADMFGMAPRAFLRKLRRVSESVTDRGCCLWDAVYRHIATAQPVAHGEVLRRFHRDDQDVLRGVLADLRDAGLVLVDGRGQHMTYRAATSPELERVLHRHREGTDELVWAFIFHEGPISRSDLQQHGLKAEELERVLDRLVSSGRVVEEARDKEPVYRSLSYSPPAGATAEGPIFDHFRAVVRTLSTFLSRPGEPSAASTYKLDLWPGHPMEEETKNLFREWRQRGTKLRERIDAYNAAQTGPPPIQPMTLYIGLCKDALPKPADFCDTSDKD
jgi:hypothetical protein